MTVRRPTPRRRWMLGLILFAAASTQAADPAAFDNIDTAAKATIARKEIPSVAYGISQNGRVLHTGAFGFADVEQHRPATIHTAYALASLTKPITATALLTLRDLTLDTPVIDLLPLLADADAADTPLSKVTVDRLLHHTAGLGTYARIYAGDEIATAPAFPASLRDYSAPVQTPGRVAEYSNLGYGILGEIIAKRSGMAYGQYVRRHVFTPLKMRDAFIATPQGRRGAVGYDTTLAPLPTLWNDTPGAGNAYASVEDLLRFGRYHLAPESTKSMSLSPHRVLAMRARDADNARHSMYGDAWYGQGWYVRGDARKPTLIWHEGGMPGSSTLLALYPAQGIVVTVLINRSDAQAIAQSLADQLVRQASADAPTLALDPVANYSLLAGPSAFAGEWQGSVEVDHASRPCSIHIDAQGNGQFTYLPAPGQATISREFHAMVSDGSLISAVQGPWQSHDAPDGASALLLKLVRTDDRLEGALVAYASPERLKFLLPFQVSLQRKASP
jgi:CubicO group peptidase (beta-lactamase class C family)